MHEYVHTKCLRNMTRKQKGKSKKTIGRNKETIGTYDEMETWCM